MDQHPNIRRFVARALLAAAPVLAVGVTSGTAAAKDGDVEARGRCSASSTWKLKGGHRDGGIEAEFEVDSNRVGQTWRVTMADNGVRVLSTTRTTKAPSGSFEVERRIADRAGADRIVATATNPSTGETCRGVITV